MVRVTPYLSIIMKTHLLKLSNCWLILWLRLSVR